MKTNSINEETIPLARAINNEGDLEQNILVAEALTDSDSRDKTLEDKNSKTQGKGYGFEAPVPQDNISSSSGFWGRFDDQQASAVTVLPTDAAFDTDIPVANARLDDRKIRHAFIRKVYLILIAQLFVTFGACAFITLHESTRNFVLGSGMPLYWFNAIMMLVLVCALSVHKVSLCFSSFFGIVFKHRFAHSISSLLMQEKLSNQCYSFISVYSFFFLHCWNCDRNVRSRWRR